MLNSQPICLPLWFTVQSWCFFGWHLLNFSCQLEPHTARNLIYFRQCRAFIHSVNYSHNKGRNMVISTINLLVCQIHTSLTSFVPPSFSQTGECSATVPEASVKHTKAWWIQLSPSFEDGGMKEVEIITSVHQTHLGERGEWEKEGEENGQRDVVYRTEGMEGANGEELYTQHTSVNES